MSDYNEIASAESPSPLDPRPIYVTLCFVEVTLCASLFVFLLMERFAPSSFLSLDSDLSTLNVLSAIAIFLVFLFTTVGVVSVWIRNRRLLNLSNGVITIFVLTMGFVLWWVASVSHGGWDDDLRHGFFLKANGTSCPTLADDKCCGWNATCPSACRTNGDSSAARLCADVVKENIEGFADRVIPLVSCVALFHIVALIVSCTSAKWRILMPSVHGAEDQSSFAR